jgi:tetratricopeptide (TPR) repeat protein
MDDFVTYRQQVNFCGKPRCRKCRDGIGHGPYWYAFHVTADGRKERVYIGKNLPPGMSPPGDIAPLNPVEQYGEIDALDRLLAADPGNEAVLQRLALALALAKRRGEALRACQRFFNTLRVMRLVPSQETQALYEAVQRGGDLSQFTHLDDDTSLQFRRGGGGVDEGRRPVRLPTSTTRSPFGETDSARPLASLDAEQAYFGRSNQSPLVGRDSERETLRQLLRVTETALRQSRNDGAEQMQSMVSAAIALERPRPQFIALMGESGIGKTRLAEETARAALRDGWTVVWSHAYAQESGIPYRMWSEALRGLLEQGIWRPDEMMAEQQTLGHIYPPLMTLLPELQEWWPQDEGRDSPAPYNHNPLSPEQEQARLREAVYKLLTNLSSTTPLLIVLDDVQWADGSSCEMLGYLARRLQGHPIALLATCRETELTANTVLHSLLAHMQREHAVEYARVEPLTDAQIATLVAHLPGNLVQDIQAQAAGNPFFAEELAFSLRAGRGERGSPGEETSELPKTITAALNQRVQRLSPPCQQLLGRAAVLGGSFGLPLICAMETGASAIDEDSMLDMLDEALRLGVLTEEGTGTRITYRFWHPLLASHLYTMQSAARRARLHRRAAEVLPQVYAGREDEQAAAITGHLLKGGGEAAQIAHFAQLAANYAYALSAYPEAEYYYRLTVQYVEAADPQHGHAQPGRSLPLETGMRLAFVLERMAECMRIEGKFQEARQLFERVLEVRNQQTTSTSGALDTQEVQVQALLWGEIGWTWRYTGDSLRAWQCCERGEQVLREAGITSGPAPARLRFQQGSLRWQEGKYEEAYRIASEALQLFEGVQPQPASDVASLTRIRSTLLGDPVDVGRALALLGAIAYNLGQHDDSLRHLNTALTLYEKYDRQREIAHVCCNIGYTHMKLEHYSQANTFLQRSFALAERIGDVPLTSVVLHIFGLLAESSGEGGNEEAERYFRRALALAEQINDREYLSTWHADLAGALMKQGKLEDSAAAIQHALRIARAIHNIPCIAHALVALGKLRIAQARTSGDARYLKRAGATLRRALALPGLDTENHTSGQSALAEVEQLLSTSAGSEGDRKSPLS